MSPFSDKKCISQLEGENIYIIIHAYIYPYRRDITKIILVKGMLNW